MGRHREEREHVQKALALIGHQSADLRPVAADPPDFEFEGPSGARISIEHTRLFRGPDAKGIRLQSEESERDKIAATAELLLQALDLPRVFVNVDFRDSFGLGRNEPVALTKNKRASLARAICGIVASSIPPDGERVLLANHWSGSFPPELEHVHIWRSALLDTTQIAADGGAVIPPLTREDLAATIAAKNERLRTYAADYSENWLVVVVGLGGLASEFDLESSSSALAHDYISDFDQIFLLCYLGGTVQKLSILKPAA